MKGLPVQVLKNTWHDNFTLLPYIGVHILPRLGDARDETPGTNVAVPDMDDAFGQLYT